MRAQGWARRLGLAPTTGPALLHPVTERHPLLSGHFAVAIGSREARPRSPANEHHAAPSGPRLVGGLRPPATRRGAEDLDLDVGFRTAPAAPRPSSRSPGESRDSCPAPPRRSSRWTSGSTPASIATTRSSSGPGRTAPPRLKPSARAVMCRARPMAPPCIGRRREGGERQAADDAAEMRHLLHRTPVPLAPRPRTRSLEASRILGRSLGTHKS